MHENKFDFSSDMDMLIKLIRIRDQFWCVQTNLENDKHSEKATSIVNRIIERLGSILLTAVLNCFRDEQSIN